MRSMLSGPRTVVAMSAIAALCAVEGSRPSMGSAGMGLSAAPGASILASRTCLAGIMGRNAGGAMHIRGGASGKGKKGMDDEYANIQAPKKAMSGYMIFANDVRPTVTKENPDKKMTELSGIIGDKWKNLDQAGKEKYLNLAEKAKKDYEKAKADYEAKVPANVRKDRDQFKKKKAEKKAKKAAKDPNAPKKPLSAFMIYSTKQRDTVKAANPDLSFGDLTKKIASQWTAMTDAQKEVYNKDAAVAKDRYLATLAKYNASKPAEEPKADKKKKAKK